MNWTPRQRKMMFRILGPLILAGAVFVLTSLLVAGHYLLTMRGM